MSMAKPSRQAACHSKSAKLVDEACIFAYLTGTMTRHLFALLALLTGLAAFASPAQASLAETIACKPSIAAVARQETAASESPVLQPVPTTLRQSRALAGAEPRLLEPVGLRPPVLMGIERAIE
jgi:F0F1-type ATP synthase membrane subunit c/vacuolar-type H+-ATPase subunit K